MSNIVLYFLADEEADEISDYLDGLGHSHTVFSAAPESGILTQEVTEAGQVLITDSPMSERSWPGVAAFLVGPADREDGVALQKNLSAFILNSGISVPV